MWPHPYEWISETYEEAELLERETKTAYKQEPEANYTTEHKAGN